MARVPISFDNLVHLTVDEETNKLFWRNAEIVVERKISLRPFELGLATLGAIGAVLAGVHPFGVTLGWW